MNSVVVDTDVFSFLFKGDTRGESFAADIEGKRMCLSFMTVAELLRWSIARKWGEARRDSLKHAFQRYVILPYDFEMAACWANIATERTRAGQPISCGDCWIAAAALRHNSLLVTHNAKHFGGITGLRLSSR